MGFGKNLKSLLNERGMNVTTFAKKAGLNRGTIYSIIRRDQRPNLDIMIAVYDVLGIEPEILLGDAYTLKRKDEKRKDEKKKDHSDKTTEDPRFSILSELTPDELIRVTDFARGLIAARSNQ